MSTGEIVIKLELDDKNFKGSISGATGDIRQFERAVKSSGNATQKAEGHHKTWARTLRDSVIVIGLARHAIENLNSVIFGFPTAVIRANAEIERMTFLLRGLSTESSSLAAAQADANRTVNSLFELAKKTPFEVNALTDSFVKMKAVGLDPAAGGLQSLVDSVAMFGGTADNLKRASIAIQQMAGKGVISMEELRQQLGESVPNAIQTMSRGLGIGMKDMIDLISKGAVESNDALAAMFRQMGIENDGAAERMSETWDGLMNRLKTRLTQAAKEIGDAGFFDSAKSKLDFIVNDFVNRPEFSRMMYEIGDAMTSMINAMSAGVVWIYENFTAVKVLLGGLIALTLAKKTATIRETALNAVKAKTVAINKALIAQDVARAKLIKTNSALIGSQMLLANNSLNYSMMRSVRISATMRADMTQLGNLARATGNGLRTLGTGLLGVFGGWAGLIATMAAGAATYYFSMREEHNETYENLQNKPLRIMSEEQIRDFANKASKAKNLRLEIKELSEEMQTLPEGVTNVHQSRIEVLERQLKDVEEIIGDADEARARLIEFKMQSEKNRLNAFLTVARNDIRTITQEAKSKYIEAYTQDLKEDGSVRARERNLAKREEYETTLTNMINTEIDKRKEALQQEIDERINRQDEASRKEVAEFQDKMAALDELRTEMLEKFEEKGGLTLMTAGSADKELDSLQQYLMSRQKMLAKYNSRTEGGNPYMAELEAMIEMGKFAESTSEEIDKARELMVELWKARQAWDNQNAETKAFEEALGRINQLSGQINSKFEQRANSNPLMRDTIEAEKLRAKLREVGAEVAAMTEIDQDARRKALESLYQLGLDVEENARGATVAQIESATKAMNTNLLPEMEQIKAQYDDLIAKAYEWRSEQGQLSTEELEAFNAYLTSINATMADEMKTPMDELIENWTDGTTQMQNLWTNTMESFVDTLTNGIMEGKLQLEDFVEEFGRMVIKMQMQKAVAGIVGGLGNALGGTIFGPSSESYLPAEFANGGIMTPRGSMALKTYANGGIANSPQVAIYGEGRQPEAYVPLPDGRSIPVTVSSESGRQSNSSGIPVTVNMINQSGSPMEAEAGEPRFDGRQYVLDVVLTGMNQPGAFRSGMKSSLKK